MPEAAQKRYLVHIKVPEKAETLSRERGTRGIIGNHPESRKATPSPKKSHS